ncbi:MAG: ribose-phosphate diphosphokinase [Chloroflexi bacterium]|nr:ribose-phosphate diphosphokinase [Chloroflexota bacterium]
MRRREEDVMFRGLSVYTGNAHPEFANDVAEALGQPLGRADVFKFPNDEIFVQIKENAREHDVFVIQSLSGPGTSDHIMELLIMLDAFRRASAGRITAVMPYFAYGQSDKKDQPRVPITARLLADLVGVAGADRFLTMDLHQGQVQGFFSIPGDELSAFLPLVNYFTDDYAGRDDAVVVVPDLGFAKKGRNFAEKLRLPTAFVEKRRRGNTGETEIVDIVGDIGYRRAIIIDDLINTGGTVLNTVNALKEGGIQDIVVACVHALLMGGAAESLCGSGIRELVVTDTVPLAPGKRSDKIRVLSVAPLFAETIRRIHEGESVGALFTSPTVQLPLRVR